MIFGISVTVYLFGRAQEICATTVFRAVKCTVLTNLILLLYFIRWFCFSIYIYTIMIHTAVLLLVLTIFTIARGNAGLIAVLVV
jgi:hypothetical protein